MEEEDDRSEMSAIEDLREIRKGSRCRRSRTKSTRNKIHPPPRREEETFSAQDVTEDLFSDFDEEMCGEVSRAPPSREMTRKDMWSESVFEYVEPRSPLHSSLSSSSLSSTSSSSSTAPLFSRKEQSALDASEESRRASRENSEVLRGLVSPFSFHRTSAHHLSELTLDPTRAPLLSHPLPVSSLSIQHGAKQTASTIRSSPEDPTPRPPLARSHSMSDLNAPPTFSAEDQQLRVTQKMNLAFERYLEKRSVTGMTVSFFDSVV